MAGAMQCLSAGCKFIVHRRGLCVRHYKQINRRVLSGELTWEEAAARGLCLANQRKKAKADLWRGYGSKG